MHKITLCCFFLALATKIFAQTTDTTLAIHFTSGNHNPNPSEMTATVARLKTTSCKITVVYGYADSIGSSAANLRLSNARCVSVIQILNAAGIAGPIKYEGRGEVKTGANENLAASRRVDIEVAYTSTATTNTANDFEEKISHLDLNDIQFLPDLPALEPASLLYLPEVLSTLQEFHHARFEIIGYVNWITNHPENRNSGYARKMQELSAGRAKAVYDWLADNGIEKSRMTFEGKSNDSLIFNNPVSDKEKLRNMRVRIIVHDSVQTAAGKR